MNLNDKALPMYVLTKVVNVLIILETFGNKFSKSKFKGVRTISATFKSKFKIPFIKALIK